MEFWFLAYTYNLGSRHHASVVRAFDHHSIFSRWPEKCLQKITWPAHNGVIINFHYHSDQMLLQLFLWFSLKGCEFSVMKGFELLVKKILSLLRWSSHIPSVLISVKYRNFRGTLDVYLLFFFLGNQYCKLPDLFLSQGG